MQRNQHEPLEEAASGSMLLLSLSDSLRLHGQDRALSEPQFPCALNRGDNDFPFPVFS